MRRHPSHYLTDEQLDRLDTDGINDPIPQHLPRVTLAQFAAEVEAVRATFHQETT